MNIRLQRIISIIVFIRHNLKSIHRLNRIDTVIGVSEEITNTFKKYYPKHKKRFRKVLNGVDVDKFRCPKKRDATRRHFGFESEHFVVGMVANFRKVKNHACLIRAVHRLKDELPQLRVLLVGMGFPGDTENTEDEIKRNIIVVENAVFLYILYIL